ncbi:MAG: flavodoxin [Candidatus Aminicenantes bacterium]|nr:flavodoxin [Candidatus Aminicenantes bacterium]
MSTVIIYASRHGCAEKAARVLESKLENNVAAVNLKKNKNIDPAQFDTVIIGGSIHAGHVQGKIKKFCGEHVDILKTKKLGLYLCCMEEGEKAQAQFTGAYPAELRDHAIVTGLFGGEFDFERMNFLEKAIVKKVAGISASVSKIKEDQIEQFAAALNEAK